MSNKDHIKHILKKQDEAVKAWDQVMLKNGSVTDLDEVKQQVKKTDSNLKK